jgi:hypothetical protein
MKNLIICGVGDCSLHPYWIRDVAWKNFDLFLIYYGDQKGMWEGDAEHYVAQKGTKYELLSSVAKEYGNLINAYDTIWLPDDDILTDTKTINRMFNLFAEKHLKIAQPALDRESHVNVPLTRKMPFSILRYTRCLEIMVPIFSIDAFNLCKWTLIESKAAWGIDWLWIQLVNGNQKDTDKVAILDATPVTHTRKQDLTKGFYNTLETQPFDEMKEMLRKHGLEEEPRKVRSFLSHKMVVKVFGRFIVVPLFPNLRTRLLECLGI